MKICPNCKKVLNTTIQKGKYICAACLFCLAEAISLTHGMDVEHTLENYSYNQTTITHVSANSGVSTTSATTT